MGAGKTERQIFEKGFEAGYDRGQSDSAAGKLGYAGLAEEMKEEWENYKRREEAKAAKAGK
jgi:flagellar biosynthesis/type III secretory pathway protein FliH